MARYRRSRRRYRRFSQKRRNQILLYLIIGIFILYLFSQDFSSTIPYAKVNYILAEDSNVSVSDSKVSGYTGDGWLSGSVVNAESYIEPQVSFSGSILTPTIPTSNKTLFRFMGSSSSATKIVMNLPLGNVSLYWSISGTFENVSVNGVEYSAPSTSSISLTLTTSTFYFTGVTDFVLDLSVQYSAMNQTIPGITGFDEDNYDWLLEHDENFPNYEDSLGNKVYITEMSAQSMTIYSAVSKTYYVNSDGKLIIDPDPSSDETYHMISYTTNIADVDGSEGVYDVSDNLMFSSITNVNTLLTFAFVIVLLFIIFKLLKR